MTHSTFTTCLLVGALALTGCSKPEPEPSPTPQPAPAPQAPTESKMQAGMEAPASLTDQLSKNLGLTPAQASAGVGAVLAYAQNKLPASDFDRVASGVPGSQDYLQSAKDAGVVSADAPIQDAAGVNSALGKLGISPEVANQFVPQVTDYISTVAGPEVGGMVKGLF